MKNSEIKILAEFGCNKCGFLEKHEDDANMPRKCPKCDNKAVIALVWYITSPKK